MGPRVKQYAPVKSYIRSGINERRKRMVEEAHAAPAQCLVCAIRMMPTELDKHRRETCKKERPVPHQYDSWISEMGVVNTKGIAMGLLRRLGKSGAIRHRDGPGSKDEYLLRDVEQYIDCRRLFEGV